MIVTSSFARPERDNGRRLAEFGGGGWDRRGEKVQ